MPPKNKVFINDANLERLIAALDAPAQVPVIAQAKAKPVGLTLGNWKETSSDSPSGEKKKGKDNSVFSRVIDVLSRGNYGSAEAFKRATSKTDKDQGWNWTEATKGFFSGIAGKDKTRFKEVLDQNGFKGRGAGTLGVALDVFADPTTYAGGLGLLKGAKALDEGSKLTRGLEAATPDLARTAADVGRAVGRKATTGSFRKVPKGKSVPTGLVRPKPTDISNGVVGSTVIYRMLQEARVAETPAEAAAFTARLLALDGAKGVPSKFKATKRKQTFSVEHLLRDLETPAPVAATSISRSLPSELDKAAPKYNYGQKSFAPTFSDGVTKALFIVAGKNPSKSESKYLDFLRTHFPGESDAAIKARGVTVKNSIKEQASKLPGGNLAVPSHELPVAVPVAIKPTPVVVKAATPATAKDPVKIADAKYDSEFGFPGEPKGATAKLRALAATGDEGAIRNLKAIEADPSYQGFLKAANKAPKAAKVVEAPPVAKTVPEILEAMAAPKEAPTSTVTRLADADEVLSNSQRTAAELGVAKSLDTMSNKGVTSFGPTNLKKSTEFTPENQVNAFNSVYTDVLKEQGKRKATPRRVLMADPTFRDAIIAAYKRVEAGVEAAGKKGQVSMKDGTHIRLSSFLERLSPEDWNNDGFNYLTKLMNGKTGIPKYDEMRALILAGSHTEDAVKIKSPAETIIETFKTAIGNPTDAAVSDLFKASGASAIARTLAKDADLSPVGAATLGQLTKETVIAAKAVPTEDGLRLTGTLTNATATITRLTELGDVREAANALARLNKDNDRYLGIYVGGKPAIRLLNLSRINAGPRELTALKPLYDALEKTEDWLGLAFRTAYGKDADGNILHYSQDIKNVDRRAVNNATQRSSYAMDAIRNIFAGTPNKDARLKVFRDSQADTASPLAQRMDNVKALMSRNSVTDKEANEMLVRMYPKPAKGAKPTNIPFLIDETKGFDDWTDLSREVGDDVAKDLFKFETAVDKVVVERQVYNHLANHFGQVEDAKGLVQAEGLHPMLDGKYFTPTDLQDIKNYKAIVRDFGDPSSPIMQHFDKVQGIWKTMATRANPQYYVRNGVGEVFINWLNGVSVRSYNDARKITQWRNPEVPVDGFSAVTGNTNVFTHSRFGDVTTDKAWTLFNTSGARQTFAVTDNLTGDAVSKAPGKVMSALNNVADTEEGFLRMAHFIDIIRKSKAKTLQEAADEAAATVNRAHGDYADLTKFERKVAKRIIPFYTWQRKVTPILLESAARNPGKVMVYPKIQIALAQNYGLELDDSNPFPQMDQLLPNYLQDGAAVPYYTKSNGNPVLGDPGNPFNDQLRDLTKPGNFLENSLGPAVKIPLELYGRKTERNPNGTRFFGDSQIKDKTDYLADQIPLLSTFNRLTRNQAGPGTDKAFGADEKGTNVIALLNWLTASRLTEVTDRVEKSGEFDAKAKVTKANKKAEAEAKK